MRAPSERIRESLGEVYAGVEHIVGAVEFAALVGRFVRARHASTLDPAGLAPFLRFDPLAVRYPFVSDLAELEWAVARAVHAPERAPLDPASVTDWTLERWERATLRFQPSVAVLFSAWPVLEIWRNRFTPLGEIDVDLCNRPDQVLVRRCGPEVACESISRAEAMALTDLAGGRSLGEVAARLAAVRLDPDAVSEWFVRWMRAGMVVSASA